MDARQLDKESEGGEQPPIRFANDSDLTFVNYGTNPVGNLTYRQDARIHNARRRRQRSSAQSTEQVREDEPLLRLDPTDVSTVESPLDPLFTIEYEFGHQASSTSPQDVEQTWRSTLPSYFGLPQLNTSPVDFPEPAHVFLDAARASESLCRAILVQPVVMHEAEKGNLTNEAVYRNQAMVLEDFNQLAEAYGTPNAAPSSHDFECIFASAFALSGHGFGQEAAYNAIIFLNSIFMSAPHNQAVIQTLFTEWMRMLMPRPGPDFQRTLLFQQTMLQKVNAAIDFFEGFQNSLHVKFQSGVSQYLRAGTSLHQILCTELPDKIPSEPYQDFHLICFHRILSMLLRYFDKFNRHYTSEDIDLLARIERLAHVCSHYPPAGRIALFTWCLLSVAEDTGLNHDQSEICFSWTMKELLWLHHVVPLREMTTWLLYKADVINNIEVSVLNISELRQRMRTFYETDIETANQIIGQLPYN